MRLCGPTKTSAQVLHALGGWPEGVWYRTDPSGQPHGALVWIRLCGSALHVSQLDHAAERTGTFCQILLDTAPVSVRSTSLCIGPGHHVIS